MPFSRKLITQARLSGFPLDSNYFLTIDCLWSPICCVWRCEWSIEAYFYPNLCHWLKLTKKWAAGWNFWDICWVISIWNCLLLLSTLFCTFMDTFYLCAPPTSIWKGWSDRFSLLPQTHQFLVYFLETIHKFLQTKWIFFRWKLCHSKVKRWFQVVWWIPRNWGNRDTV